MIVPTVTTVPMAVVVVMQVLIEDGHLLATTVVTSGVVTVEASLHTTTKQTRTSAPTTTIPPHSDSEPFNTRWATVAGAILVTTATTLGVATEDGHPLLPPHVLVGMSRGVAVTQITHTVRRVTHTVTVMSTTPKDSHTHEATT